MKKILLITCTLCILAPLAAQDFSKTRLIAKFKETTAAASESAVYTKLGKQHFKNTYPISFAANNKKAERTKETLVFTFNGAIDILNTITELQETGLFDFVEPDYIGFGAGKRGKKNTITTPNDPLLNRQWGLSNNGTFEASNATEDADVDMDLAWTISTGNEDITIAVLDSGLRMEHPEFTNRIWVNINETEDNTDSDGNNYTDDIHGWDFVNNDNDPTDDHGHGTNVTGIIAATGNNAIGYAGADWKCKIMPLKILDENNSGYYSTWIAAINYATNQGVKIMNMSVGGSSFSQGMKNAVDNAHSNGIVIVACMMNFNNDTPYYPAAFENTIAVGSTDADDTRSNPFFWSTTSGSNYGNHIDVVAPGNYIYGLDASSDRNYDYYWGGTSQAAPLVAGICSLILDVNPELTTEGIRTLLRDTAEDLIGDLSEDIAGWDPYYGAGRVNAYNALQRVLSVDNVSAESYYFYPNPATSILYLSEKLNGARYQIYNTLGQLLLSGSIIDNKLNISSIGKGSYILKVQDDFKVITKKIIKN